VDDSRTTSTPPAPSSGRRLIGIEGLRGIAALLVIFRHVGQYTTDGALTGRLGRLSEWSAHGLTLFFVLSGFLLFRPFAAAIVAGDGMPSVRRYARNRALRIGPAYVVIFTVTCLILGLASLPGGDSVTRIGSPDGQVAVGRLTNPIALALNLGLLQTYVPGYLLTGISPAWSLTAEIAFYIALPMLAVGAAWLLRHRVGALVAITAPPALLIVLGLGATTALAAAQSGLTAAQQGEFSWGQTWSAVLQRSFLAQADLFGYGMLAAVVVVVLHRRGRTTTPRWPRVLLLVACPLLLVLPYLGVGGWYTTNMVGIAAAGLLTAVVLPSGRRGVEGNVLARRLEWSPVRYAGLISYSVYLWHVPVILGLEKYSLTFGAGATGLVLTTLLTTVVVAALASLTYFFVERPAMTRRAPWHRGTRIRTEVPVAAPVPDRPGARRS
jgi:peptidoglycan/LPS O-acetylase OafA/YrhL